MAGRNIVYSRPMVFWILASVLTAVAALAILAPAMRARAAGPDVEARAAEADLAVYRDQISEVERDLARGLIDDKAAAEARNEISRRLLKADERSGASSGQTLLSSLSTRHIVNGFALIFVPVATIGLYLFLGAPDVPDQPLQSRLNASAEDQTIDVLIARVERHLAENPDDGQGWEVLGPVYMRLGDAGRAADAYRHAIRLLGSSYEREIAYAEALMAESQGVISVEARQALQRANALAPEAIQPRYYLADALTQQGDTVAAIAAWQALLRDAQEGAAWVEAAQQKLAELQPGETAPSDSVGGDQLAGPSAEDVAAAEDLTTEERRAMIAGMVSSLADRLNTSGGTVEEWARLIRAYVVTGDRALAAETLEKAKTIFKSEERETRTLDKVARELGFVEGE